MEFPYPKVGSEKVSAKISIVGFLLLVYKHLVPELSLVFGFTPVNYITNMHTYPTKQRKGKIIDSKVPFMVGGREIWDTSLEATQISNIDTPKTSPESTAEKESIQSKHGDDFSPVTPPKINSSPLKNDGWEDYILVFWYDKFFTGDVTLNFRGVVYPIYR